MNISSFLYHRVLRWRMERAECVSPRSVILIVPHTSVLDGFIGLLVVRSLRLNYHVMAAQWLFFWPFRYGLRWWLHAFPVGTNLRSVMEQSLRVFDSCPGDVNLVICPEGHRRAVKHWGMGFLHIAQAAGVAVDCVRVDYGRRTFSLVDTITAEEVQQMDREAVVQRLRRVYEGAGAGAKYPRQFCLPE